MTNGELLDELSKYPRDVSVLFDEERFVEYHFADSVECVALASTPSLLILTGCPLIRLKEHA